MTLHPQALSALDDPDAQLGEIGMDDPRFDPAAERAADRTAALADDDRIPLDTVRDVDAGGVPCRLYRPGPGAQVMLYVHGGGWVFHDLETHDAFCRYLARETGWALLAVDYRKAPEHPYPAPLDDVETALSWLRGHGDDLDVDTSVVPGIGDSSGANLVAGLCLRDPVALAAQILVYPPLDAVGESVSMQTEDHGFTARDMRWFWTAYAPDEPTRHEPEVSPLLAPDLSGLPPAYVLTAEHDVLRDEGEAYAARLADAGVPVTAVRALGMIHGFWRQPDVFDASRTAVAQVAGVLRLLTD